MSKMAAMPVQSSIIVALLNFATLIEVSTIRQNPSKLADVLSMCGDLLSLFIVPSYLRFMNFLQCLECFSKCSKYSDKKRTGPFCLYKHGRGLFINSAEADRQKQAYIEKSLPSFS